MTTPDKFVPIIVAIPGGAGGAYLVYDYATTPEELMEIRKYSNEFGGCKFWFIQSSSEQKGWYDYQAVFAKDLREAEDNKDKFQQLLDQLKKGKDDTDNTEIAKKCSESYRDLLEIMWIEDKWKLPENWDKSKHNPAT